MERVQDYFTGYGGEDDLREQAEKEMDALQNYQIPNSPVRYRGSIKKK